MTALSSIVAAGSRPVGGIQNFQWTIGSYVDGPCPDKVYIVGNTAPTTPVLSLAAISITVGPGVGVTFTATTVGGENLNALVALINAAAAGVGQPPCAEASPYGGILLFHPTRIMVNVYINNFSWNTWQIPEQDRDLTTAVQTPYVDVDPYGSPVTISDPITVPDGSNVVTLNVKVLPKSPLSVSVIWVASFSNGTDGEPVPAKIMGGGLHTAPYTPTATGFFDPLLDRGSVNFDAVAAMSNFGWLSKNRLVQEAYKTGETYGGADPVQNEINTIRQKVPIRFEPGYSSIRVMALGCAGLVSTPNTRGTRLSPRFSANLQFGID